VLPSAPPVLYSPPVLSLGAGEALSIQPIDIDFIQRPGKTWISPLRLQFMYEYCSRADRRLTRPLVSSTSAEVYMLRSILELRLPALLYRATKVALLLHFPSIQQSIDFDARINIRPFLLHLLLVLPLLLMPAVLSPGEWRVPGHGISLDALGEVSKS